MLNNKKNKQKIIFSIYLIIIRIQTQFLINKIKQSRNQYLINKINKIISYLESNKT